MKKRSVKVLVLILALAMFVGIFAGCASETETAVPVESAQATEDAETQNAQEEIAEQEEVDDEIQLPLTEEDVSYTWFIAYPSIMSKFFEEPFTDYPALAKVCELTGVNIDWYAVSNDTEKETFNIMLSSGEICDVFSSSYLTGSLDYYVEQEIIMDIKEAAQTNMPNYLAASETYDGFAAALGTESDQGYWSVVYSYTADAPVSAGMVIRQDWLDELGLDTPVTYDDYYNVLTAFKNEYDAVLWNDSAAVNPYNFFCSGYGIYGAEVNGKYAFYNDNGAVKFGPYTQEYKDYLTMMNQWYTEGLLDNDFFFTTRDIKSEMVNTGKAGIWNSTLTNLNEFNATAQDEGFKIAPVPDAVKNVGDTLNFRISDSKFSARNCVSYDCENVELLLRFFDYMFTDEGTVLKNWGVEGLSWEKDENGDPQFNDFIINPPELPAMSLAIASYTAGTYPGITLSSRMDVTYDQLQLEAKEVWDSNCNDSGILPDLISLNEEEDEIVKRIMGDVSTYVAEMSVGMIVGTTSIDEFDSYMARLEEMGIQDCLDCYQAAMERYNSKAA